MLNIRMSRTLTVSYLFSITTLGDIRVWNLVQHSLLVIFIDTM